MTSIQKCGKDKCDNEGDGCIHFLSPILHIIKHKPVLVGLAQKLLVSFTVFAK